MRYECTIRGCPGITIQACKWKIRKSAHAARNLRERVYNRTTKAVSSAYEYTLNYAQGGYERIRYGHAGDTGVTESVWTIVST